MKKTLLLALVILPSLAGPSAARHGGDGVTVFRDVHFGGQYETFYGDVPDLSRTYLGNDEATSVVVPRGCRATLYRKGHFRGHSITIGHDIANLSATAIGNDHLSSLRVDCGNRGSRRSRNHGYDDGSWSGTSNDYYGPNDPYDSRRGRERHGGGRRGVLVFAGGNFSGRSELFAFDDGDLGDNRIGHDTISSIHVSPGCSAIVFEHPGFRGRSALVTGDVPNMRYVSPGNDRISSMQVDCRGR